MKTTTKSSKKLWLKTLAHYARGKFRKAQKKERQLIVEALNDHNES